MFKVKQSISIAKEKLKLENSKKKQAEIAGIKREAKKEKRAKLLKEKEDKRIERERISHEKWVKECMAREIAKKKKRLKK